MNKIEQANNELYIRAKAALEALCNLPQEDDLRHPTREAKRQLVMGIDIVEAAYKEEQMK